MKKIPDKYKSKIEDQNNIVKDIDEIINPELNN